MFVNERIAGLIRNGISVLPRKFSAQVRGDSARFNHAVTSWSRRRAASSTPAFGSPNTANIASAAASKMGERVRLTEGNTCYRGGKPGVSDVFAAALWSADYSLLLASNDYSGVNLHGGTGKSVANSVGGSLPGDSLLQANGATPEQIAAHPHPFYTPIATFGSDYVLEPVAYGLKFAGSVSGGTLLKTEFSANAVRGSEPIRVRPKAARGISVERVARAVLECHSTSHR